jgi:CubicO group peptidase (beta-lactamase class C family)
VFDRVKLRTDNRGFFRVFAILTLLLVSSSLPFLSWEASASDLDERIQRVENGLYERSTEGLPIGEKLTLVERMEYYKVPGVSIAVINDFKIEWAKGYGVLEAGGNQTVTQDTLFQSASIGKPVTAAAALYFVEQGLLDLDENVNDKLVSWKVPENEFTAQENVTLRRLLSHTAGVTVQGFRGYAQGERIPTLLQVLDGEYPANNAPIRVDIVPGTEWRYSGGGLMIVQQLLEDVVGKPFPDIMQETVLGPTGMTSSIYAAPLPEGLESRAATAHSIMGEPASGKWHELVCMGAGGGLWTTSSDLARFAIEIMRSRAGQSNKVLSQEMVNQMLAPQIDMDDYNRMGLGFLLGGEGQDTHFWHAGGNLPGFLSLIIAIPERGLGIVVMTNGIAGDSLYDEILMSVGLEYGLFNTDMTIYVKDNEGRAISGVSVISLSQPEGQEDLKGITDTDGSMVFTDVRLGNYTIQASKSGYTTETGMLKAELEETAELTILLEKEAKGIPGFSYESIVIGIAVGILLLWWMSRRT